ncbi:TonB-dependent receptor [Hydrogenophaga sp. PAMC20947]|uniref:TonB-dependent receptor plug domain-containing protein n=1 Tax=Hydrogenophaga sp. PAMC20947 TaxID=2565558 RepID=UPI00109DA1BA|nr:TonB-dependent receptor [Hydrogenophaga sp. PAMC20947]QCB44680.1 TonB-dependent receptor [Hydrogenophaga sp. PAMC20947]
MPFHCPPPFFNHRRSAGSHHPLKVLVACLAGLWVSGAWAASAVKPVDATWMSLEELMLVEVSSAAKRPQTLADTTAAAYVVGRDDIRRSGATHVAEVLRLVPGVQVSRIDGSRYAVSIRGFSNRYSGKLLVLQDGRTLYSPLFGGTYWEAQDVVLEDVERIEVIRGSGGTLWGANAVNGVINIITRQAKDTQGTFLEAKAGSLEQGVALRHGTTLGEDGHMRAYLKLDDHEALDTPTGEQAHDAWRQKRAGFRADFGPTLADRMTVQGDVYETLAQQSLLYMNESTLSSGYVPDTSKLSGVNLLARWQHQEAPDRSWHVQAYVDQARVSGLVQKSQTDTLDLEWQSRMPLGADHDVTWGLGYRLARMSLDGNFNITMTPSEDSLRTYSGFVQDEIRLRDDWQLTLGSKLEHNEITGLEVQPNARLLWRASPTDSVWAAISRSVQTPSLAITTVDSHVATQELPVVGPAVVAPRGNPDLSSEVVVSRELGYRGQLTPALSLDAALFHNTYKGVVAREFGALAFEPYPVLPVNFSNNFKGTTYGFEVASSWQVAQSWQLKGSYSWLNMSLNPKSPGIQAIPAFGQEHSSPQHLLQLHSLHNLSHNLELDANLYFNSKLGFLTPDGQVDLGSHTRLDLRLGWRPARNLEVSLVGRNLLTQRNSEYVAEDVMASEVPRSVLLQAKWTY